MKKLFAIALSCLISWSYAQKNLGTIQYQETIQLKVDWSDMDAVPEAMKAMIPREQQVDNILYFTPQASLYTNSPTEDHQDATYEDNDSDVQIDIQIDYPEQHYYHDLKASKVIRSKELFGKKFLITGSEKIQWKLLDETKIILGYRCKKATTTKDGKATIAWYTSSIPVAVGPAAFHHLPGAVLEVDHDKGAHTITATRIDLGTVNAQLIMPPKKGKKVTAEQFNTIAKRKAQEMADLSNGNTTIIIETETR